MPRKKAMITKEMRRRMYVRSHLGCWNLMQSRKGSRMRRRKRLC